MDNFLLYLLKVAAGTALFCITYLLFFRKETFYVRNRVILILSILIPVIIPLLTLPVTVKITTQALPVSDLSAFTNSSTLTGSASISETPVTSFDIVSLISWMYFTVAAMMIIRGLISVISTYIIIRKGKLISGKFPRVLLSEQQHPPFSFFPYAVIPARVYKNGNYSDVLDHEFAHLRQGHTFDLLLIEFFLAFQWFNPFAWLIRRFMVLNHEYLADHVSLSNRSLKEYQYRLLSIAGASETVALAHTFNSLIKNRIIMINMRPTNRKAAWKTLLIVPAVLALSYAFVEPEYKYVTSESSTLTIQHAPQITKKGVKGIVYNEDGKPFEGVKVINTRIPDEAFAVKTGTDGSFSLGNIKPDESIMFFITGYKRLILKPDFDTEMTVRMERDPEFAARQISTNKQGDVKLPQLVVIDGVVTEKDFFSATQELGYNFGLVKMISGKEATDKYGEKGAMGVYEITTRKRAIETGQRPPIRRQEPEDYPTFQGKQFNRFTDWVADNASYPEEALNKKMEGWVSVNFKVQLDGSVTDIVPISVNPDQPLENEIIRVIQNCPKWDTPKNKLIDEPFASSVTLRFRLPDQVLNETPFVVVEQMPMYPGGDSELLKYIADNTRYPEAAKAEKVEGRVIVRFIVTREGNADGVSILKSVHPLLDEEAVRVVTSLKGFDPGKQGGIPVDVWYMVPITFVCPEVDPELPQPSAIGSEPGKKPLLVVDGVITDTDYNKLDPKTFESVSVYKDKVATDKYGEKGKDGVIEIKTKKESSNKESNQDTPFVVVENMPEFPGGNEEMLKWISSNLKYPEVALQQKIEGKVTVRFVVSSEGKVGEVVVLKSDNQIFNEEAIRVISSMPLWKPGSQSGKKVNVYSMVPVEFKLNN